jgi:hypothetical protein
MSTAAPHQPPRTYAVALALAGAGYLPFPCKPFSKMPATRHGFKDASSDEDQLKAWFDNDAGLNLAIACGPQPNGIDLLAIDVDPKNGGDASWAALTADHGTPLAPRHDTPSGGFHLFFDAARTSGVHRLGTGIDTRGEGGYVVVPPSTLTDDRGEIIRYRTSRATALIYNRPLALPTWLSEALCAPQSAVMTASVARHPSNGSEGPYDRIRASWSFENELGRDGWTQTRRSGGDVYYTRPGKDPRDGHSAVLHPNGSFVVWTTERPFGGKPTNGADGAVFSPGEYVLAYRFGGDFGALARAYPVNGAAVAHRPTPPSVDDGVIRLPAIDPAYWSATARNAHIRTAAWAARVNPDALDLVMLAMQACLIPPGFVLERMVGRPQPLNMLSCLVANTGDFKSSTIGCAQELLGPFPPWVQAIGMGSGEGIGATFLDEEYELNDKGRKVKTGRLTRNSVRAAFFEADEGSGLTAQASRLGATVIANLCKAWSGSTLGEANSDPSKRRRVVSMDYRVAAAVNIQPSNFAGLFSVANTGTGLTGRFLFAGALDPTMPDLAPAWPGELSVPSYAQAPVTISFDDEIKRRADEAILARHRRGGLDSGEARVGQAAAVTARVAAILALSEDRRHVTEADWMLAAMRSAHSSECLQQLALWEQRAAYDNGHSRDRARAASRSTEEEAYEAIKIGQTVDRIRLVLGRGPAAPSSLSDKIAPSMRPFRDVALDLLTSMGKIELDGKRWKLREP